jgi:PAS domain S-box-containing protein
MASAIEKSLGNTDTSLTLLKVLADNSFDSILITDATVKGKITYANKAFKKLTGHDQSDVIGKTPRILQGSGTDKKVIDRLAVALKSGGKFEGKAINYKKDGTPFIMYWRVLPIKVGKKIEAWLAIQREGSVI